MRYQSGIFVAITNYFALESAPASQRKGSFNFFSTLKKILVIKAVKLF